MTERFDEVAFLNLAKQLPFPMASPEPPLQEDL